MKKFIFLAFILVPFFAFCQDNAFVDSLYNRYGIVLTVPSSYRVEDVHNTIWSTNHKFKSCHSFSYALFDERGGVAILFESLPGTKSPSLSFFTDNPSVAYQNDAAGVLLGQFENIDRKEIELSLYHSKNISLKERMGVDDIILYTIPEGVTIFKDFISDYTYPLQNVYEESYPNLYRVWLVKEGRMPQSVLVMTRRPKSFKAIENKIAKVVSFRE